MVSSFNREPEYKHGTAARTAILLVNLGTPDAPTKEALRRYLKQFLSDRRVVELSELVWKPVLNGVILNTRPAQSAAKYAKIWEKEGSPLKIHTAKQANLLTGYLGKAGAKVHVDYAMRYGSPSIPDVLSKLKAEGYQRILVIPLYPQYAASTTATVVDEVGRWLQKTRNQPEIRFLRSFCDHSAYIDALAISVRHHWFQEPPPARDYCLVMSFHGMPRAAFEAGDPYHCECQKTARLLASKLNIGEDWQLTFQSRFGRAKWLEPYTAPTLQSLARQGIKRVDILCPGFVSDCLETLEEIAIEAKSVFLKAGGQEFNYIPCLNEDDAWIRCLVSLSEIHLAGWPVLEGTSAAELAQSAALAKALGAKI